VSCYSCYINIVTKYFEKNQNKLLILAQLAKKIAQFGHFANLRTHSLDRSAKANGREPKSCLGQVFNYKFGCFDYERNCIIQTNVTKFKVENSAQVLSFWLKFVQGILKGKYHRTIDLLFDWFGLICFANKNKNCQLSYSWFQTSQTGGQQYSVTSIRSLDE